MPILRVDQFPIFKESRPKCRPFRYKLMSEKPKVKIVKRAERETGAELLERQEISLLHILIRRNREEARRIVLLYGEPQKEEAEGAQREEVC